MSIVSYQSMIIPSIKADTFTQMPAWSDGFQVRLQVILVPLDTIILITQQLRKQCLLTSCTL